MQATVGATTTDEVLAGAGTCAVNVDSEDEDSSHMSLAEEPGVAKHCVFLGETQVAPFEGTRGMCNVDKQFILQLPAFSAHLQSEFVRAHVPGPPNDAAATERCATSFHSAVPVPPSRIDGDNLNAILHKAVIEARWVHSCYGCWGMQLLAAAENALLALDLPASGSSGFASQTTLVCRSAQAVETKPVGNRSCPVLQNNHSAERRASDTLSEDRGAGAGASQDILYAAGGTGSVSESDGADSDAHSEDSSDNWWSAFDDDDDSEVDDECIGTGVRLPSKDVLRPPTVAEGLSDEQFSQRLQTYCKAYTADCEKLCKKAKNRLPRWTAPPISQMLVDNLMALQTMTASEDRDALATEEEE